MGSNGFSSERKQKRVDLLKQLLDTNISTHGSSNPLEALLSGLDLGSLEGLMQKNKKSHHDDWDSKKKRHHDDCSDHDWDHKKKHDHDDCGCKKKKHDHDDCGCKKKKHDHDDCGCKKKKHDHDDCGCKKKKRCKCCPDVTRDFREAINAICQLLNAATINLPALKIAVTELEELLLENEDCVDEEIAEDLLELIDIIQAAATVAAIPPGTLDELGRQLNKLRRCLGLRVRVCGPGGGDGQFECDCNPGQTIQILNDVFDVLVALESGTDAQVAAALAALVAQLNLPPNVACVDATLRAAIISFIGGLTPPLTDAQETALTELLIDLVLCLGLGLNIGPGQSVTSLRVALEIFLGRTSTPVTSITTVRQRLLDLLADQVVITTPTGLYAGTLVAVQTDYIAVVAPTGTYLIPLDQIQTFTTE